MVGAKSGMREAAAEGLGGYRPDGQVASGEIRKAKFPFPIWSQSVSCIRDSAGVPRGGIFPKEAHFSREVRVVSECTPIVKNGDPQKGRSIGNLEGW